MVVHHAADVDRLTQIGMAEPMVKGFKCTGVGNVGGSGSYNLVSCAGLCFTAVSVPVILGIRKLLERIPTMEY